MQKVVWTDDKGYWFLNILATHPDSQGRGIGGALVRHIAKTVSHLKKVVVLTPGG